MNDQYAMCRYPGAVRDSRGPMKSLEEPYVALLDSRALSGLDATSLTVGVETRTQGPCIDLSASHAGPNAIMADRGLMQIARGAEAVIVTVPGAHQLSNHFYRVHTWRNDRVIAQEHRLRTLYPEIEFDRHHFVRHLLEDLHAVCPERFAQVREALQFAWLQAMNALLAELGRPVILAWIGERWPDEECETIHDGDPAFVTEAMTTSLPVAGRVEVIDRPRSPWKRDGGSQTDDVHEIAAEGIADCLERLRLGEMVEHRRSA